MKTKLTIIASVLALGACTITPERQDAFIEQSRAECELIGWSLEHTPEQRLGCIEEGYRQRVASYGAVANSIVAGVAVTVIGTEALR